MSEPETDSDVPDPLAQSKRIEVRTMRPWHGRFLFFALGLGTTVSTLFGGWTWMLPWAGGAAVVTLRLTRGKAYRWISYIAGAVALPLLLIVAILGWFASGRVSERLERTSFDAVVWQAAAGGRYEDRIRMIDDLLSDKRLRESLGRTARERIVARHNVEGWIAAHERFYRRLLPAPPAASAERTATPPCET